MKVNFPNCLRTDCPKMLRSNRLLGIFLMWQKDGYLYLENCLFSSNIVPTYLLLCSIIRSAISSSNWMKSRNEKAFVWENICNLWKTIDPFKCTTNNLNLWISTYDHDIGKSLLPTTVHRHQVAPLNPTWNSISKENPRGIGTVHPCEFAKRRQIRFPRLNKVEHAYNTWSY